MTIGATSYPGALDTAATLVDAVNNLQTTLANPYTAPATTLDLTNAAAFPANGNIIYVGGERTVYTGKSGNQLTGVTALSNNYVAGSVVEQDIDAAMLNALRDAVIALETRVGATGDAASGKLDGKLNLAGGTMTGFITLHADPDAAMKAATKQYVDNTAAGLDVKPSVRAASTGNLTLSGTQTVDGISLIAADRCLAKNQSTASQNGIYAVSAGAWTRVTDMDAWTEVPGAFCFVELGTVNADTGWVCTADQGGTLDSTSITWSQFTGVGAFQPLDSELTALAGLTSGADKLPYFTGSGAAAVATFTAAGRALVDDADAAAQRTTLGLVPGTDVAALSGANSATEALVIAVGDETTAIAAGTTKVTLRMPYAFTLSSVRGSLATAQTSGSIFTVDINEAGTSVISTKLTIDNTEKTSQTAAAPPVISDASLADDAEMTIDIDQIGDGTAKGLKVILIGKKT